MKNMLFIALLFFISIVTSYAQIELDKLPSPEGGMEAITQKVIYPSEAKDKKVEGKVMVKATISKSGDVISVSAIKVIGFGCDDAACEAAKKTKFTSAEKDGKKIEAEIIIPFKFKLCDTDKK